MYAFKKIKFINHEVLGNMEIDLRNNLGMPFNNVLLVGINGSGKTKILEELANLSYIQCGAPRSYIHNVALDLQLPVGMVNAILQDQKYIDENGNQTSTKISDAIIYKSSGNESSIEFMEINGEKNFIPINNFNDEQLTSTIEIPKIFSSPEENKNIDISHSGGEISAFSPEKAMMHLIKMALADERDRNLITKVMFKEGKMPSKSDIEKDSLRRFKEAFDQIFNGTIEFEDASEKEVLFNKKGKILKYTDLSSGEKNVIFRAVQLLSETEKLPLAFVLIDEPELGLHPSWEENVLNYYISLFTDKNRKQISQMFFTTHSPLVIKSALERDDVLVVCLDGTSNPKSFSKASNGLFTDPISHAQILYYVFGVTTNDLHTELFGTIESYRSERGLGSTISSIDTWINEELDDANLLTKLCLTKNDLLKSPIDENRSDKTLTVWVRNLIHHPKPGYSVSDIELENSIKLMNELIKKHKIK